MFFVLLSILSFVKIVHLYDTFYAKYLGCAHKRGVVAGSLTNLHSTVFIAFNDEFDFFGNN